MLSVLTMEKSANSARAYGQASYSQLGEDVLIAQRLRRARNGFYADVGAYHPYLYSNTELLRQEYNWSGINIDVCSSVIEEFNTHRKGDINVCAAVGSARRTGTFYEFEERGYNTTSDAFAEKWKRRHSLKSANLVEITTLPEILAGKGVSPRQVNMLNLDVSGSEFDVLMGIDWSKFRPEIISVSNENLGMKNIGKNRIYIFLSALGYKMIGHLLITSIFEREFT
jgi:FkbM family methyltransferase